VIDGPNIQASQDRTNGKSILANSDNAGEQPLSEKESKATVKEFLLAEYSRFADLFWRNEQTGETRVNWFIGIITATIGGLIVLVTKAEGRLNPDQLQLIAVTGLAAVLVYGLVTFARMIIRNEKTDEYKKALDTIRQRYQDYFDADGILLRYYPLDAPAEDEPKGRRIGGLAHIVAATNALMVAGVVGVLLYPYLKEVLALYLIAVVILGLSFAAQWRLASARQEKAKKRLRRADPTHAGGVVFEVTEKNIARYLIVRPSDGAPQWVLPKGKIADGELHGDAALREVREETGVTARIVCPIETVEYRAKGKSDKSVKELRVKFYLMEKSFQGTPKEERQFQWATFEEAYADLEHPESKDVLQFGESLMLSMESTKQ